MTWAWSHSAKAYQNAYNNLADETPDCLIEMMTEWKVYQKTGGVEPSWMHDPGEWDKVRREVRDYYDGTHSLDLLIADIWDQAQAQATCDNDMKDAWMCPYGCHTVSFDRDEEE